MPDGNAVWHYPEAIDALCAAALGAKGLARAARLAALGNFEDGKMGWTLVGLLDDREVRLRAASFAALQKAQKDGFGYAPAATAEVRKAAVGRWTDWVTQRCGPAPK